MSEGRWRLEVLGGDTRALELPESGSVVVGSTAARAGFVLDGQGVDEAHCAIGRTKEGDWAVKDLGSRYGTILNGQRVTAARLKLGDQLVLGSRRLEVRPAKAAAPPVGAPRPSDVPQRIDGYRIERLIGKGAMGSVYLAVQESLRRPVALKVLNPRLASDRDFVHRFQAEARAAAALSHPNVVVVYDVGEEDGSHFLSMEFMAGGSLEQKLAAAGPLPWKAVLSVLTDAAGGLAYAESRGIVHRDIKPANLMYSGTGTIKIADLGLATTIEQEASEVVEGGRRVFGTPHFISPEQARGEAVGHRSDLYSLGATAYRLLSGKTPFEGGSTREILRALQTSEPKPLAELVPDLPADLGALIARLMQKDPAARFPTAESLKRECERLRLVAEHGPVPEAKKGSRAQLVLGVLLLAVVGAASAVWFRLSGAEERGTGGETVADSPQPFASEPDAFFEPEGSEGEATSDEETALRERERLGNLALRELPPLLSDEERARALEKIMLEFAGTGAAASAERELAALRARPSGPLVADLEAVVGRMTSEADALAAKGASFPEVLRAIDGFRPPPEVALEFEARRAAAARERIVAAETTVRTRLTATTALALEGRFDELRKALDVLAGELAGLDTLPGDPAAYVGLRQLAEEVAAARARVDEQEAFFLANLERARRRAVGETLGPASGILGEIRSLNLEALDARLAALAPELAGRALCATLSREGAGARTALAALTAEFAGGGWRRKALVDPRSRKVREVRDVQPDGLVFDKDGALEHIPWSAAECDPDWFHQLFQARLGREWTSAEAHAIAALLRLVGAARAAALARAMIDPGGRGILEPADLEALGKVFEPALAWLEGANDDPEQRAELEEERTAARRLAQALEAAQSRSWTGASTYLESVLTEFPQCLVVGLLSDGSEWRAVPELPQPPK